MSKYVEAMVWRITFPTQSQKLILLKLADYGNDEGASIYPARDTIAEMVGCSLATVKSVLKAFRECGLVSVLKEGGSGPRDTTHYSLNVSVIKALSEKRGTISGSSEVLQITVEHPVEDKGPNSGQGANLAEKGASPDPKKGPAGKPQSVKNQISEPSQARAGDADAPLAPAAKKRWLVLREDNDWWKWVSVAEHHYPGKGRKMFEEEGGMVVFDEVPVASACQPPKLPPPSGSALYDDLVKARGKALTDRSRAMAGDREDVG